MHRQGRGRYVSSKIGWFRISKNASQDDKWKPEKRKEQSKEHYLWLAIEDLTSTHGHTRRAERGNTAKQVQSNSYAKSNTLSESKQKKKTAKHVSIFFAATSTVTLKFGGYLLSYVMVPSCPLRIKIVGKYRLLFKKTQASARLDEQHHPHSYNKKVAYQSITFSAPRTQPTSDFPEAAIIFFLCSFKIGLRCSIFSLL